MSDFAQRIESERTELWAKIKKLTSFVNNIKYDLVDTEHQKLLLIQHRKMMEYHMVLCDRLELLKKQKARKNKC